MATPQNGRRNTAENSTSAFSGTEHGFCPIGGLHGEASGEYNKEVRSLLARRLLSASLVLLIGFVGFLLRYPFIDFPVEHFILPHSAVVVILAGLAALLYYRRNLSLTQLRGVELAVFGVPAVFFIWMQVLRACDCPAIIAVANAHAFPAEAVIPWLLLIQVYGFYIPNNCKRAAIVVIAMAVTPLVGMLVVASQSPEVADVLWNGRISAVVLWLSLGAVISIYGSHRLGVLRRQAFDAKRFGAYTLREKLGSGGMGEVYVAEHQLLKRRCAIKLIKPEKAGDPNALARFESEVQAAARLTHPNTIEIYDYGLTQDGTFYYVMEFLPGLNLQEIVERFGPLPPERVVHLLKQVCSALREAHNAGLVHRDIKPGNIFAAERGGLYDFAKLLDFGLVKSVRPDAGAMQVTQDGVVVGSPMFAAPEAAVDGEPIAQSDIYSLGATAYFLLTGRPVFPGENVLKVLFAHATEMPQRLSDVYEAASPELEAVVMKCLEKKPADRYATVSELESALAAIPLEEPWTQSRAADWWSHAPEDHTPTDGMPESSGTAVTMVMPQATA